MIMNEAELKSIWQSYDKKIEMILEINKRQLYALQTEKAESKIRSFVKGHTAVMILGIVWIIFLSFLVYHSLDKFYFSLSVSLLIVFNIFAVIAYIRHIAILTSVSIEESITETQRKISLVRTSDNLVGRILLLQTPLYCTWWYTEDLVQNGCVFFWTVNAIIVGLFTAASIFLFIKLSPNNQSARWLRWTNKYFGSEKLTKASEFLQEIEEFKKEN
jgi:hypothetical protein